MRARSLPAGRPGVPGTCGSMPRFIKTSPVFQRATDTNRHGRTLRPITSDAPWQVLRRCRKLQASYEVSRYRDPHRTAEASPAPAWMLADKL